MLLAVAAVRQSSSAPSPEVPALRSLLSPLPILRLPLRHGCRTPVSQLTTKATRLAGAPSRSGRSAVTPVGQGMSSEGWTRHPEVLPRHLIPVLARSARARAALLSPRVLVFLHAASGSSALLFPPQPQVCAVGPSWQPALEGRGAPRRSRSPAPFRFEPPSCLLGAPTPPV